MPCAFNVLKPGTYDFRAATACRNALGGKRQSKLMNDNTLFEDRP